jgi:hypothetical protein
MNLDTEAVSSRLSWLSIFTSASTLVCCALPALLVALGAGTALVSLVGVFPQLVWLSQHKVPLFIAAGAMLAIAGWFQHRARFAPCPADAALAARCRQARRVSLRVYFASLVIFAVGFFFAFVAPLLL